MVMAAMLAADGRVALSPISAPYVNLCAPRGGGRKTLADHAPGLMKALEHLLDPFTRGDPQGPLRWTCSSAARLAEQLGGKVADQG